MTRPRSSRLLFWTLIAFAALPAAMALAHEEAIPENFQDLKHAWVFEPTIVLPLLISAWLYAQGLIRTWRASEIGGGIRVWEAGCFAGGWLALIVALVSPLHPWGRALFSVHMAQHEILMLIAAPLLVLGRPMAVFLRALPITWARSLAHASNNSVWQSIWCTISNALVAWFIHAAVLWVWHAPALMNAVIDNEFVHALQHICFLFSALLFWWAVIHGRQRALGYGMAVLYMFTTALHSGLLGVLMTFATSVWYPAYTNTTQAWGLTPLEDQQLGGLIMWIPAGVVYIVAGLALLAGWMKESEARLLRRRSLTATTMVLLLACFITGCERPSVVWAHSQTGGQSDVGRQKIEYLGCASCHSIPGVGDRAARVGPPLDHIASRAYIGTGILNDPTHMVAWIQNPRQLNPQAGMPNLHINETDARDIASYLYTLR